ncbi:hypothetical protein BYT27DRAFT_7263716 [Phlegmacium glaucopus]|nr:hypothetical protein BYT27DRAFT_7263716 [Phlegmacium glaucopus]
MSISVFNPFSLNHASQSTLGVHIQEVTYYAESRFWCILNEISAADTDRQSWTQRLLHRELLFILSYIGIATALGQQLDVLIILRSLTDSMAMLDEDALPLPFNASFLATLDIGVHDRNNKSQVVSTYDYTWWSGRKPRNLSTVTVLDASNLETCLNNYQLQRSLAPASAALVDSGAGASAGLTQAASAGVPTSAEDIPSPLHAGADHSPTCHRCNKYRDLLSDVLQDVLRFRNVSSLMSTSSEHRWKLGVCRASTFHLLQEAALLKETAVSEAPAPGSTAQWLVAVAQNASSELNRLRQLPPTSYKWTWGETLTKAEILALRRTGTRPGHEPHSGYDHSLKDGRMLGDYTEDAPSPPTADGLHNEVPAEATFIPPATHLVIPPYLSHCDPLSYNPVGDSTISLPTPSLDLAKSSRTSTDNREELPLRSVLSERDGATAEGMPEIQGPSLDLADVWSDTDDISGHEDPSPDENAGHYVFPAPVLLLADEWNDSEEDGQRNVSPQVADVGRYTNDMSGPFPAPAPASLLLLANQWTESDDEAGGNVPPLVTDVVPPAPALLLAEAWNDSDEESGDEDSEDDALALTQSHINEVSAGHSPVPVLTLADSWSTSSQGSDHSSTMGDEMASTEYTVGSQLVVSPSRITLVQPSSTFLNLDTHVPPSDDLTPAHMPLSSPSGPYGPQHFAYLQDHMFEDDSSDEE